MQRLGLLALFTIVFVVAPPPAHCATGDAEIHSAINAAKEKDSAEGATIIANVLQELATRAANAGRNIVTKRNMEVLMCDAQDVVIGMKSPEAAKAYAAALPRLAPDALVTLLYGLKLCPGNADVDSATAKVLSPNIDFRVRTVMIDMLGAHRYAPAFDKIAAGLDPNAMPAIQISTCRALAMLSEKKGIPALIKYMLGIPPGKGGRYIHEATVALRTLTGQNFTANPADWKKWWDANQKDFAIDGSKSVEPDYNYELREKQDLEYYEVPVVENRLVIILDVSGSMKMGGKPSRLDSAKTEMKSFVKSLPEKTLFNIVSFSGAVNRWHKDVPLLAANEVNKKDALKYIDSLKEGGGTQTALAMEEVLQDIALKNGCETVYLVTDGNPNPWAPGVTADQQERLISWINQSLKIRINTIGIYSTTKKDLDMMDALGFKEDLEAMKKFLYELASHNDGAYREVGKDGGNKVVKVDPKKEKEEKDKAAKDVKDKDKGDAKDVKDAKDAKEPKDKDAKDKPELKDKDTKDDGTPTKPESDIDLSKVGKDKVNTPPQSEKDIDIDVKIVRKKDEPKKDEPPKPDEKKKKPEEE
ncbi:MAG TPA: VWA domain-containing protein [Planctomycetota bacterium]|nr:VWA domain-containing protein [Planctomycetota bacterium]